MRIDLSGRVVVITGASRGIGRATALMAAAAGGAVVLAARNPEPLEAVADAVRDHGGAALALPLDLTARGAPAALVKGALDRFGRVDVLVNNAATTTIANTVMQKDDDLRAVFELNVFALVATTQAALRPMIRARWGRIVNIASVAAKYGPSYNGAYAASKAAVLGHTRTVARETAGLGITANAICPWHVRTDLVDHAMERRARMFGKSVDDYLAGVVAESPMKRLIDEREVAGLALYLMSDLAAGITGQSLNVCGGALME